MQGLRLCSMNTGCHHNQCTNYKGFAKRDISLQFKLFIHSPTVGYLPILSLLDLGRGQNFSLGARSPQCSSPGYPQLHPCKHCTCTRVTKINIVKFNFQKVILGRSTWKGFGIGSPRLCKKDFLLSIFRYQKN